MYNILKPPITAHFIQILPLEWHNHISLRIEIYGCPGIPKYFQTVITVTKNLLIKPLVNLPGLHQHSAAAFFSFQHFVWVKSCDILTNRHVILKATISQLLWLCLQLTSKNMTTNGVKGGTLLHNHCFPGSILPIQGCALAEPSGPWHLTFALGRLENLRFFIQIICWAP